MTLDPDVEAFARLLREIEALLSKHGQDHGAREVNLCLRSIERSDAYGLHRFLGAFGGMGSLNDVVFYSEGVDLTVESESLRRLKTEAFQLGQKLARE